MSDVYSILQGINRAFPFIASDDAESIIEIQTPVLFKLVRLWTSHSEQLGLL